MSDECISKAMIEKAEQEAADRTWGSASDLPSYSDCVIHKVKVLYEPYQWTGLALSQEELEILTMGYEEEDE